MSIQSRKPKGTPVGGQFASQHRAESNVKLDDNIGALGRSALDRFPRQRIDDVVAYAYKADILCPSCMVKAVPAANPEAHDAEDALDICAAEIGVDRYDENTFDSDQFPKVVFRDQVADDEACGECGERLS